MPARVSAAQKIKEEAVLLVAGHWLILSVAINIGLLLKVIHDGKLWIYSGLQINGNENGVTFSSLSSYVPEPRPENSVQIREKYINLDQ